MSPIKVNKTPFKPIYLHLLLAEATFWGSSRCNRNHTQSIIVQLFSATSIYRQPHIKSFKGWVAMRV